MSVPKVNFYLVRDTHPKYPSYFLLTFKPRCDSSGNWVFSVPGLARESISFISSNQFVPILEKFGLKELECGTCLDLTDGTVFNVKEAEKAPLYN